MPMPRKWPRGYYTYILSYPDGIPYYVGAGKNNRANPRHKRFAGHCPEHELQKRGQTSLVTIIEQPSREEAFAEEHRLIVKIGRQDLGTGTLFNVTDGLGSRGYKKSQEMLKKISDARKNKKATPETRLKISRSLLGNQHLLGHKHSAETRMKISLIGKGKKPNLSDEERKRRSEACARRNRERIHESHTG